MRVRLCPRCGNERPATEFLCQGEVDGGDCGWDLTYVQLSSAGQSHLSPPACETQTTRCPNGHPFDEGDIICSVCGAAIESDGRASGEHNETSEVALPDGWQLVRALTQSSDVRESFLVLDGDRQGVLTLYREGSEPDPDVQNVLRNMDVDHIPRLIESGRFNGRSYEIFEHIIGGSLEDIEFDASNRVVLDKVVDEIGRALDNFAQVGLRHRDLRPRTILIRSPEEMDLVIDGFGSARLSDFDLDVESPLEITRYMAPEAIAGGVAAASDWWSLGMMLLEKVTHGDCFHGIHEQAFLINVLANGVPIPDDLDPDVALLLRGLLARDRDARWQWTEVKTWLNGEPVNAPDERRHNELDTGSSISLGEASFRSVRRYALAASEHENWEEGLQQFEQGLLLNWLQESQFHGRGLSGLRSIRNSDLHPDDKLSIVLKILNPDMPLIRRGEIISPAWLIENPIEGYRLIASDAPNLLDDLDTERWLTQLKRRESRVREIAKYHEIELNEERLQIFLVATSVAKLKAQWAIKRRFLPDTDHHGLATVMDRRQVSEEDLIILCAAEIGQFRTIQELVEEAAQLAQQSQTEAFDQEEATQLVSESTKAEILSGVEERIRDFATCSIDALDKWADQFRIESRISLSKALVLHSIPAEKWTRPPRHAYIKQLITYFEQKLALSIRQGPLSRMTIAKTSARIDLTELEAPGQPAEALLNRLIKRSEYLTTLDPQPFIRDPMLERRLRNLERQATLYKRDTGIDGLYLGFPFLLMQLPNRNTKPRIAPVLLWPIKLVAEVGQQGQIRIAFDKEREQVRFNPAIESYIGSDAFKRWKSVANAILGRSISDKDVVDEFGQFIPPRGRELGKLPGISTTVPDGPGELASAAVLFHVKFMGQAVVEDLRQLRDQRIEGSALEPMLRLSIIQPNRRGPDDIREIERYLVVDSDPSQEKAVFDAREKPGLVVSGPPGTGKSQTIVNIIADAIGRNQSLLVVCQKRAALEVVLKRLEADGLGDRVMMVTDENKDRKSVVKLVREQIEGLLRDGLNTIRTDRNRSDVAAQIEGLERELDSQHLAMHRIDDNFGLSYRDLIAQLVALEEGPRPAIDCRQLRDLVASLDKEAVIRAREKCSALSTIWLNAKFEDSPLSNLKEFGWDPTTIQAFSRDFLHYSKAEAARIFSLRNGVAPIQLEDSASSRAWLRRAVQKFDKACEAELTNLARWVDLFAGSDFTRSRAGWCSSQLNEIEGQLCALDGTAHDADMHAVTSALSNRNFRTILHKCRKVVRPGGTFGKFNPVRLVRRWSLASWLKANGLESDDDDLPEFLTFLEMECRLRTLRKQYGKIRVTLESEKVDAQTLTYGELLQVVRERSREIESVTPLAALLLVCPLGDRAIHAAKGSPTTSVRTFLEDVETACDQADARVESLVALNALATWIVGEWLTKQNANIRSNSKDLTDVIRINTALPTTGAYQQFRVRSINLSSEEWAIFRALRTVQDALEQVPDNELRAQTQRIIDREQRLSWKALLERQNPEILSDRSEIESKIRSLDAADGRMRVLNQQTLAKGIMLSRLAERRRWEDITRLTGVRMKSMREFIRLGIDLGLTEVRPVWLMNPEVVSRVLPLARGLFDVVVFDEASQMPVEHAIPALYRGSVAVVSGDEKQLPPTAFFSSKIESDEAEFSEGDLPDEDASEDELQALEEVWDRREIKNCPDLLALASSSLPSALLEIHYRSHYRELISFSNHSFYAGRLHVPARHPKEKIIAVKPIQVFRVDGRYEHQQNFDEARKVVRVVEQLWQKQNRPTVGVVTFNRKQADLILEQMEAHAEHNVQFRNAYAEENERLIDGEDMRFFVKNVENVQGDERDVMIFSTTFGRNPQGTFRRTFGVLGQKGGERRLNVAVTRAKKKVVIVTSMPVKEISDFLGSRRKSSSPRDYLQAYLYYAELLSNGELDVADSLLGRLDSSSQGATRRAICAEDGFSRTVAEYIKSHLNLEPIPANDGTAFGIDFAIKDPASGLFGIGIECDSPNHDLLRRARAREIWRRKVLGQAIRKIHRVSSYGWYHSRNREKEILKQAINDALAKVSNI